ncbi:MAG TPA: alpha/beta fold hydrolase [Actinomycetota bacterium]|nr:alpha/beta fold hydrolase [Actinomycetota bacterium]
MPIADLGDINLHYSEHGDGDSVLGVMGFALDQRFWSAQIPAVTATHRFITFDNRGLGRSTGGSVQTIDEMADDSIRLLDHLGIERTVVFGVSMGGAIAQRIAIDHPDRVSALILGVTWARPIEFMRRQSLLARDIIGQRGAEGLVEAALLWMFTPKFFEVGKETIDQLVTAFFAESESDATSPEVLLAQLEAIEKHDCLADLGRVGVPTLVLGGKADMMVPVFAAEEIAQAIPGSRLRLFETGHGCMIEEMQEFNREVSDFLGSLRAAG